MSLKIQEGKRVKSFKYWIMGQFVSPTNQMDADRKFSQEELLRILRQNIALEEEAVATYQAHAAMTEDPKVKAVLLSIADEERVHIGELQALIEHVDDAEAELIGEGRKEVEDEIGKKAWVLRNCGFSKLS